MDRDLAPVHRFHQLGDVALDDLLRGFERLAGTEPGFRGGDVAGVAVSIRKYFRTLFLDVLVAPLAVVQPLRNRLR